MFEYLGGIIEAWLTRIGLNKVIAEDIADFTGLIVVFILAVIAYFVAKKLIVNIVHTLAKKSKNKWDDIFAKKRLFVRLSYFAPAFIIYFFSPLVIPGHKDTFTIIQLILGIYMIIMVLVVLNTFLNSVLDIYNSYEVSVTRPIKGYVQVVKITLYIIGGIIIIANLLDKSPTTLLLSLGTFSAVLMLIFKDPILGFVGGIQLTANNMVKIGDWISMPKYGADGTVIDISLTTVKVQNWDKTITTIPTYTMVTDYFQNWRGMEESGGRRIKRSVNIDMTSVKFCTPEMLEKFKKIKIVSQYITDKDLEIEEYNNINGIDNSVLVNGRRQTNLGVFRAYLKNYLKNKPEINLDMTFLVRQLQPTAEGVPMEVYVFSRIQEWTTYEDIQSDIFDHILAVIPHFDLRVFQNPSGSDFKELLNHSKQ